MSLSCPSGQKLSDPKSTFRTSGTGEEEEIGGSCVRTGCYRAVLNLFEETEECQRRYMIQKALVSF
jgi:hypothetical protein